MERNAHWTGRRTRPGPWRAGDWTWQLLALALLAPFTVELHAQPVRAQHAMAATGHPLATEAAAQTMRSGGNAIDAAVAAALTLGVVDGHNSGLGGGCFMLVRLPDGSMVKIDGREQAPSAATRDMFVREGKAEPGLSQTGALAIGVPGALAAYHYAARNFGRIPFSTHLNAAALLAQNGFNLNRSYAQQLAATAEELRRFEAARAIFFKADGTLYGEGDVLTQADLAKTYRAIADQGVEWFYRGPFADATEQWMKANGGIMVAEDFRKYDIKLREPITTSYRDCQIIGFPPPSSGGVRL
jgi:gamma-glutamyltranspeptidase/glutathione hydrolase